MSERWVSDAFVKAHAHDGERDVSLLAADQYFRELRWTSPLVPDEEMQLVALVKQGIVERRKAAPDARRLQLAADARARLVEAYQPLVVSIANGYGGFCRLQGLDVMDLVNEGNVGLLLVLDRLDTYDTLTQPLVRPIALLARSYILDALRESRLVCMHWRVWQQVKGLSQAEHRLIQVLGRDPTYQELAVEVGVSVEEVCEVVQWRHCRNMVSLDALLEGKETEATPDECLDVVSVFASGESASGVATERQRTLCELVWQAVQALPPQEQRMIRWHYGLDEDATGECSMKEIAACLGCPEETARSAEKHGRKRLAQMLQVEKRPSGTVYQKRPGSVLCLEAGYTLREAMERLGCSSDTVWRYVKAGKVRKILPEGRKQGAQFAKVDVERLVTERKQRATPLAAFVPGVVG